MYAEDIFIVLVKIIKRCESIPNYNLVILKIIWLLIAAERCEDTGKYPDVHERDIFYPKYTRLLKNRPFSVFEIRTV